MASKKYSALAPRDEVVVELKEVAKIVDGESITLQPAKNITMPKAAWELAKVDQRKNGFIPSLNRIANAVGTPVYGDEETSLAGAYKPLSKYTAFAKEDTEAEPEGGAKA